MRNLMQFITCIYSYSEILNLIKNPKAIMEQKCGHVSSHISMAGNTYMYGCKLGISKIRIL